MTMKVLELPTSGLTELSIHQIRYGENIKDLGTIESDIIDTRDYTLNQFVVIVLFVLNNSKSIRLLIKIGLAL